MTPARGINFGPNTYNTTSKPKTFEITNLGEFAYDFQLFDYGAGAGAPPPPAEKKGGDKKGAAAGGSLAVGQFTFEPATGRLEPGARQEVSVVFKAVSSRTFTEVRGRAGAAMCA